jgi:Zn-dependent protease with chaperone function
MTPAGVALVAASILLDLPSALARLFVTAVIVGLFGVLDWRADLLVALVAFGPYVRSIGALALPLPAGPLLAAGSGARKPSERERVALANAFSLVPETSAPNRVLVLDGPDENAWVLGSTLFVERGIFESPHLAAVMAHEAGHLAAGDGRVALAAWWLPVRSAAWVAARLMGKPSEAFPRSGIQGGRMLPDPRFRLLGGLLRLPGLLAGVVALLFAGGLFPMLLRQAWAPYRRNREYAADAFAAAAGHGPGLVEALGAWQVLDVATPWWLRLTHPYVEQRIDRLQRLEVE